MLRGLSGPAAHRVKASVQGTKWLKQRLGKRLSTVHQVQSTVRNVSYQDCPNLKILIYQNVSP